MAEWGRKEYSKKWPSRTPVWTWTAILLTFVFFAGMLTLEYERSWTAAERLYLSDYMKSGARGKASATAASKYTLLEAVVGKGQRLVIGDEIEEVPAMDGRPGYRLTEEGVKDGIARLTWVTATFNDRGLHRVMGEAVYGNIGSWDFYQKPVYLSLAFFVLALFVAVPKDRARRMLYKHGRRLRGPELVTTAEFNEKLGKSKAMTVQLPDSTGIRRLETVQLKLYDLSLDRGLILVHGKGKKDRYTPIGERAIAWLEKYVREARPQLAVEPDDMTVFLTAQGEPFSRDHLSYAVKERVDAAKLGKTGSCHLFRHTMATLMHEGGADIRYIQQMLGHEDIKTTQIYTQVAIRTLQQIHSATHPGAMLERGEKPSTKAVDPDAETLFQMLAADDEDDRE